MGMFKWVRDKLSQTRYESLLQRRRIAYIRFADNNIPSLRYCSIWNMYAILYTETLRGDISDVLGEDTKGLLLYTTVNFLEGRTVKC